MMMKANQTPGLSTTLTTRRQRRSLLDVDQGESMNVPLSNILGTLQTYLGSTYVNDLTFLAAPIA
jgi:hypothetical protein